MKYQYVTRVMTRTAGMLTVFCKNQQQAEENVTRYVEHLSEGRKQIFLHNVNGSSNVVLMSEIIAVSVGDMEQLLDVHKHEIMDHKQMEQDIEFSLNKEDE